MMGLFDKVKKVFGSKKEDESRNSVTDEFIDKPTFTQSIENDNEEIKSEDSEETHVNEEVIDAPSPNEKNRNFRYLDELIHSGVKEIVLDSDIILSEEESKCENGIIINVDGLVIDGKGHTIDVRGKTRIFYCTGKNITIKNITLKNGFTEKNGGAIFNQGELTIIDSSLIGNTAEKNGGAIFNQGELTIIDSSLIGNTAEDGGGAIYSGEIISYRAELSIIESTLNNNAAEDGGAIHNWGGELTIRESTLVGNTAKGAYSNSGAIHNKEGNFKIFNCEISNNKSPNDIILNNDYLEIHNTIFKDNQSKFIVLNEGDESNLGIFYGELNENNVEESVLCNTGKFCSIEKTVFQNNISNNTMNIINKSELTLTNPQIKDKRKSILNQNYILIRKSPLELKNIIYGEGTVEIDEKIIPQGESFDFGYLDKKIHESNTKEIILDYDITFEKYERNFYEGGIELDIDNLIINGNGKTINGSDISRIFLITGKNITLKNIIFKNGHSHKNHDNPLNNNGGAIKINHKLNIIIENCKFLNNTSESGGGAIHNEEGSLTIIESTLTGNKAGRAGAIINLGGKLIITESTLIGNTANGMGGAITNNGKLIITESTLTGNTTGFNGGAIFDNEGKLTITDSTLTGNTARGVGGAILSKNSSYEFKNCTFKDNKPDDVNEKD